MASPYVAVRKMLVPGSYWGQSEMDNMVSPQKNLNRLVSKKLEHIYLFGQYLKVLFPTDAGIPESSFVATMGEVVEYDGQIPPTYMVPPNLPGESDEAQMQIHRDMDMITSTYGPERGQFQGKLSGTAINLLVEAGFKAKEPLMLRIVDALEVWGTKVLELVQNYMEDSRVIKVTGRAHQDEVMYFRGADVRGQTDLRVEVDSVMPKSRVMVIEELTRLAQAGIFNPMDPKDRAYALAAMDRDDAEDVIDLKRLWERNAHKEHLLWLQGGTLSPPEPYEDNDVMAVAHETFMASDEFKNQPPERQEEFKQHYYMHIQAAMPIAGSTVPQQPGLPSGEPSFAEGP